MNDTPNVKRVRLDVDDSMDDSLTETSIDHKREDLRKWIGRSVFALFALVTVAYIALSATAAFVLIDDDSWGMLNGPLSNIFTAITGLVGTCIGFYFAENRR